MNNQINKSKFLNFQNETLIQNKENYPKGKKRIKQNVILPFSLFTNKSFSTTTAKTHSFKILYLQTNPQID